MLVAVPDASPCPAGDGVARGRIPGRGTGLTGMSRASGVRSIRSGSRPLLSASAARSADWGRPRDPAHGQSARQARVTGAGVAGQAGAFLCRYSTRIKYNKEAGHGTRTRPRDVHGGLPAHPRCGWGCRARLRARPKLASLAARVRSRKAPVARPAAPRRHHLTLSTPHQRPRMPTRHARAHARHSHTAHAARRMCVPSLRRSPASWPCADARRPRCTPRAAQRPRGAGSPRRRVRSPRRGW